MEFALKTYDYLFTELSDPRVYKWPLMSGPWGFLLTVAVYVCVAFYVIPSFMEHRQPFSLKNVIAVYNIFQIIACTVLVYGISTSGWTTYYSVGCQPVDYEESEIALRMARYMWWHMLVKMAELLETVFFVLRKKHTQVTGLHVYHHISTFFFAWFSAKYFAGGMISFTVILNSLVHVVMYGYYFLSAYGANMQKELAAWKPRITILQLVQLVTIFIHSLQMLNCNLPRVVPYTYLPNIFINISLFILFYVKTYSKRKTKSS